MGSLAAVHGDLGTGWVGSGEAKTRQETGLRKSERA
jgi:hypothetical protein